MVDMEQLNVAIDNSGMTLPKIAERANIQERNLYNRLRGVGEFKAGEIQGLTTALRLTKTQRDKIFFA